MPARVPSRFLRFEGRERTLRAGQTQSVVVERSSIHQNARGFALKSNTWRTAAVMFVCAAVAAIGLVGRPSGSSAEAAAATPRPSPSPTTAPTPYMPLEEIPNGSWDVIEQGYAGIQYSRMTLKEVGDSVTGMWYVDKNTTYALDGQRQGAHITLQIKAASKPDATVVGKIEADIDGIADMVGLITIGPTEVAFQGAQHGRVPPPVEASTPAPEVSPY